MLHGLTHSFPTRGSSDLDSGLYLQQANAVPENLRAFREEGHAERDSELAASAGHARHLRLAEAGRARARRARHRTALYRGVLLIGRQAQFLLLQLSDLVTQTGGLLELKVCWEEHPSKLQS